MTGETGPRGHPWGTPLTSIPVSGRSGASTIGSVASARSTRRRTNGRTIATPMAEISGREGPMPAIVARVARTDAGNSSSAPSEGISTTRYGVKPYVAMASAR